MGSVHIIGAGPAGSVAAISALHEGHKVEISEEHPSPGLPMNCSGLISKEGLQSLSNLIDYRKHTINEMYGATIDFAGHTVTIDAKKPTAFVIDRSSFDAELAQKAESEGAILACNERITSHFRGESIIGADGPNSAVASHFNFPRITRFASTARCIVKYDGENPCRIRAYLSNRISPGFFSWLIPHNDEYAELGTGTTLPGNPLDSLKQLSKHTGIQLTKEIQFALIPLRSRRKTALSTSERKVLLAGDAAGQVKSTTGGGVVFGTSCARLAGKHAFHPQKYEESWRSLCSRDLNVHYVTHLFYGILPDFLMKQAGRCLSHFSIPEYLEEKSQMDRPTKILRPGLLSHSLSSLLSK